MSGYVSSTTNMIVGALIGITFMAAIVACCCALLLNHMRKAGTTKALTATQPASQGQPAKTKAEKVALAKIALAKATEAEEVALAKVALIEAVKEIRAPRVGFFSFFTRKKNIAEGQASQLAAEATPKPLERTQPKLAKIAKSVKGKQPKTPKLKAVKEPKQLADRAPQKLATQAEKNRKFGLFGSKKAGSSKEPASKTTSPVQVPLPSDVDVSKPFVMPAAAQTTPVAQVAVAPAATGCGGAVAAPAPQPPEGSAPMVPQVAGQAAPGEAEPENKEEENTDSIFNLFTDTSGEESEISKFAANFDNVSLDSLLGDSQNLLNRISKN